MILFDTHMYIYIYTYICDTHINVYIFLMLKITCSFRNINFPENNYIGIF